MSQRKYLARPPPDNLRRIPQQCQPRPAPCNLRNISVPPCLPQCAQQRTAYVQFQPRPEIQPPTQFRPTCPPGTYQVRPANPQIRPTYPSSGTTHLPPRTFSPSATTNHPSPPNACAPFRARPPNSQAREVAGSPCPPPAQEKGIRPWPQRSCHS